MWRSWYIKSSSCQPWPYCSTWPVHFRQGHLCRWSYRFCHQGSRVRNSLFSLFSKRQMSSLMSHKLWPFKKDMDTRQLVFNQAPWFCPTTVLLHWRVRQNERCNSISSSRSNGKLHIISRQGGIICRLNARTSVLAANPVESAWNGNKTIVENITATYTYVTIWPRFLVLDPKVSACLINFTSVKVFLDKELSDLITTMYKLQYNACIIMSLWTSKGIIIDTENIWLCKNLTC